MKYLGIPQPNRNHQDARKPTTVKYLQNTYHPSVNSEKNELLKEFFGKLKVLMRNSRRNYH